MGWERNAKSQFFPNRVVWWLGLATGLSCEFKPRANDLASLGLLSCSATVGMTLQLPYMLHTCANFGGLLVASHLRVQLRVFASLHKLDHFFTLSHSLPLHDSHLNTGLLIAKIQANLVQNKANKMVVKIEPYTLDDGFFEVDTSSFWEIGGWTSGGVRGLEDLDNDHISILEFTWVYSLSSERSSTSTS